MIASFGYIFLGMIVTLAASQNTFLKKHSLA